MKYLFQTARISAEEIYDFLVKSDKLFTPALSLRVSLVEYSEKLVRNSTMIYVKAGRDIIGLVAFYLNEDSSDFAFISLICVLDKYRGNGIGSRLINKCIKLVQKNNNKSIRLEVDSENREAISFYRKFGFNIEQHKKGSCILVKQFI
jgi:ribosomal protein S18 acetylase RimI-like enzyme